MLQQSKYKDFLEQFTEEVTLVLVAGMRQKEIDIQEQKRLETSIDAEKLKMKILPEQAMPQKPATSQNKPISIQAPITREDIMQKSIMTHTSSNNPTQETKINAPQNNQPIIKKPEQKIVTIPISQNIQIQPGEINFGKIIVLIRDPLITYIECPSENQNITIKKAGQTLKTQITLTKEEIKSIIVDFSEKTRIPLVEGMLNARYKDLEISAIVSEVISPSFIIRKDIIPSMQRQNQFLAKPIY